MCDSAEEVPLVPVVQEMAVAGAPTMPAPEPATPAVEIYRDSENCPAIISKAIPFMAPAKIADGGMVGDFGFDPLSLATDEGRVGFFRDAEIKHGRLAMLAAANWPLAELLNKPIADAFGLNTLLVDGRAPSIPNGGLGQVNAVFWAFALGIAVVAEAADVKPLEPAAKISGDLGFDPLGFWEKMSAKERREMQLKEMQHGRLAMVAITGFVAQEFLKGSPTF